jgi:hypothetical protein
LKDEAIVSFRPQIAVVASRQRVRGLEIVSLLIPSNRSVWLGIVVSMIEDFRTILHSYFGPNNYLEVIPGFTANLTETDPDNWVILCTLVLSEIQPRLSSARRMANCPDNKRRPSRAYFVTLMIYFCIALGRFPDPQREAAESWKKRRQHYCITQYFIHKYLCNENQTIRVEILSEADQRRRYMSCSNPFTNICEYLLRNFDIPIAISQYML